MAGTANPRLKQIMDAAVRHMHAFVREVELTPAEWIQGLQFLTAVGQACTPIRQEFILLSDVLGVSAVVNALHDRKAKELGSQSSLLGPFFARARRNSPSARKSSQKPTVEEIVIHGTVTDTHGAPVPGALIQVWQTSERGLYDLQERNGESMDMRGNFRTAADGWYDFRTVRPKGYSIPMDGPVGELVQSQGRHGMRPSHVHMLIGADGHRELVTALYFGDDDYIDFGYGVRRFGSRWSTPRTIRSRRSKACARYATISGWRRPIRGRAGASARIRRRSCRRRRSSAIRISGRRKPGGPDRLDFPRGLTRAGSTRSRRSAARSGKRSSRPAGFPSGPW